MQNPNTTDKKNNKITTNTKNTNGYKINSIRS